MLVRMKSRSERTSCIAISRSGVGRQYAPCTCWAWIVRPFWARCERCEGANPYGLMHRAMPDRSPDRIRRRSEQGTPQPIENLRESTTSDAAKFAQDEGPL